MIRIPLVRDGEAPLDLVAVNGLQVDPRAHRKFLDTSNKVKKKKLESMQKLMKYKTYQCVVVGVSFELAWQNS